MTGDSQPGIVRKHLFPAAIADLLPGRKPSNGGRNLHVEMMRSMQGARCGQTLPQHLVPSRADSASMTREQSTT